MTGSIALYFILGRMFDYCYLGQPWELVLCIGSRVTLEMSDGL